MSYVSELSSSQRSNALGIIAAVRARKWSQKAAVIAIETALVESGMRMIASANVPDSQRYPHERLSWTSDGLGHDHASCGMFQQQTGWKWALPGTSTMGTPDGWGTPATLMNAQKSTALFLNRLARYPWQTIPNWVAAQDVQGSAYDGRPRAANNGNSEYGGNYHGQDARAQAIVAALWDEAANHQTDSTDPHPLEGDDDMARFVRSKTTNRIYLVGPAQPPREIHGGMTNVRRFANLWAISPTVTPVPHKDIQLAATRFGGLK